MIEDTTNKIEVLRTRAKAYFDNNISVHVTQYGGEWLNGEIAKVSKDFFMLQERKKGLMPVFFVDVDKIEKLEVEGGTIE